MTHISLTLSKLPDEEARNEVLNCIRCLYRIIPVLYEDGIQVLYKQPEDVEGNNPPIIISIFLLVKTLLFFPRFTITANDDALIDNDQPYPIWYPGITADCRVDATATDELNFNRNEVLKLLLALLSEVLYFSPDEYETKINKFAQLFCCADATGIDLSCFGDAGFDLRLPFHKELLYSLLNCWVSYEKTPSRTSFFRTGAKISPEFSKLSIQVLLTMLDYQHKNNLFKKAFLAMVSSCTAEESKLLFQGISARLQLASTSLNATHGATTVMNAQEALVLLWKLFTVDTSKRLAATTHILAEEDVLEVLRPMLLFIWVGYHQGTDIGLVHLCIFLLLVFSGHRDFALALNTSIPSGFSLPSASISSAGYRDSNHADLLTVVCHTLVFHGGESYNKLYSCLVTILCNISPYVSKFNMVSCTKVFDLFALFTKRQEFHTTLPLFIDLFNNIIQYQYATNEAFIYSLCSNSGIVSTVLDKEFQTKESIGAVLIEKGTTIRSLVGYLVPKVEQFCSANVSEVDERKVLQFIKSTTLVGVLPVPHAIIIRKYEPNEFTNVWFTTFLWGVVFLRNKDLPLWDDRKIKLFLINVLP